MRLNTFLVGFCLLLMTALSARADSQIQQHHRPLERFQGQWLVATNNNVAASSKVAPSKPESTTKKSDESLTKKEPIEVTVGTYVQNLTDLSLRENRVNIDFYIWFRTRDKNLKPYETFDVMNGTLSKRTIVIEKQQIGDLYFSQVRVLASLAVPWNLHHFPMDNQTITLQIEDNAMSHTELVYLADKENSSVREDIWLSSGYQLIGNETIVQLQHYKTNFGDELLPSNHGYAFSHYTHSITIGHIGMSYFFKLLFNIFLLSFLSVASFLIDLKSIQTRIALLMGILFSVITANYVIATQLPASNQVGLADKITIICILFPAISLIIAVFQWKLFQKGYTRLTGWLDQAFLVLLPCLYILAILLMVKVS